MENERMEREKKLKRTNTKWKMEIKGLKEWKEK
jgi:hypothetical protein